MGRLDETTTPVVPVYSSGLTTDGRPYLIMKLMKGGSVERLVQATGPLPPSAAMRFAREVGRAIAASHEKGIVHCDIKPANILLDDNGDPRLSDFGISIVEDSGVDVTRRLGATVAFSPREVLLHHVPTERSDIYSFGATLHYVLRGVEPFRPGGERTLMQVIIGAEAPPPLPDRVPAELAALLGWMMQPDSRDRPTNIHQVLAELDRIDATVSLESDQITRRPASTEWPAPQTGRLAPQRLQRAPAPQPSVPRTDPPARGFLGRAAPVLAAVSFVSVAILAGFALFRTDDEGSGQFPAREAAAQTEIPAPSATPEPPPSPPPATPTAAVVPLAADFRNLVVLGDADHEAPLGNLGRVRELTIRTDPVVFDDGEDRRYYIELIDEPGGVVVDQFSCPSSAPCEATLSGGDGSSHWIRLREVVGLDRRIDIASIDYLATCDDGATASVTLPAGGMEGQPGCKDAAGFRNLVVLGHGAHLAPVGDLGAIASVAMRLELGERDGPLSHSYSVALLDRPEGSVLDEFDCLIDVCEGVLVAPGDSFTHWIRLKEIELLDRRIGVNLISYTVTCTSQRSFIVELPAAQNTTAAPCP